MISPWRTTSSRLSTPKSSTAVSTPRRRRRACRAREWRPRKRRASRSWPAKSVRSRSLTTTLQPDQRCFGPLGLVAGRRGSPRLCTAHGTSVPRFAQASTSNSRPYTRKMQLMSSSDLSLPGRPQNTALKLRRRRSPKGEREAPPPNWHGRRREAPSASSACWTALEFLARYAASSGPCAAPETAFTRMSVRGVGMAVATAGGRSGGPARL
jgi:hypothetical protein